MPALYRVPTCSSIASDASEETIQEIDLPHRPDSYTASDDGLSSLPSASSGSSFALTSPLTPSSSRSTFSISDEPRVHPEFKQDSGAIPADDWGYDLYHATSRQTTSSSSNASMHSDPSAARQRSERNILGLHLHRNKDAKNDKEPTLKMSQLDLYAYSMSNHSDKAVQLSRQRAVTQSRSIASFPKLVHRENGSGAVKLVMKSAATTGEDGSEVAGDDESVYTTVTTSSSSSKGDIDEVRPYGRGGAGRATSTKVVTTRYHGSASAVDEIITEEGYPASMVYPHGSASPFATSSRKGVSGGKAFIARRLTRKNSRGNVVTHTDVDGSSIRSGSGSDPGTSGHAHSSYPDLHSMRKANGSRTSLGTIRSQPQLGTIDETPAPPVPALPAYGRGGAARKSASNKENSKEQKKGGSEGGGVKEESAKPKSRAMAMMSSMKRGGGNLKEENGAPAEKQKVSKEDAVPAFGRGGASRKKKDQVV